MKKESIDKIEKLSSELNKVQSSRSAGTLLRTLSRISRIGEKYSAELAESGNLQLSIDVLKRVAEAYDIAAKRIDTEPKFSKYKSFSELFQSTASRWQRLAVQKLRNEGKALQESAQYEQSLQYLDEAVELKPADSNAWLEKGITLYNMGKFGEAINCFDKAAEINPDNAYAFCNKGLALASLGRYEDALRYFNKAIVRDPKMDYAFIGQGWTYFKLRKYTEAKEAYEKALALNDKDVEVKKGLANVYHDGFFKPEIAQKYLEEALKLQDRIDLKADLSEVLLASTDYERAERLADAALKADPDRYGFPMRLVKLCSLYFSDRIEEATVKAMDLLEYYKSIRGKQEINWIFRGFKAIVKEKNVSKLIKEILRYFIYLAEDYDYSVKNKLLATLREKIEIMEKTNLPFLPEKVREPTGEVFRKIEEPIEEKLKAVFQREPTRIMTVNTSEPDIDKPGYYYWEIHLAPINALENVEKVVYTLHETFPDPVRVVTDRKSGFRLRSKGWGDFRVKIDIYFNDGRQPIIRYHYLRLGLSTPEINL